MRARVSRGEFIPSMYAMPGIGHGYGFGVFGEIYNDYAAGEGEGKAFGYSPMALPGKGTGYGYGRAGNGGGVADFPTFKALTTTIHDVLSISLYP